MSANDRQRRLYNKELLKIIHHARYTIEASDCSVLITDANGIILYVNAAFCKLTGYKEQEIIGKMPHFFSARRHSPTLYLEMWETISNGKIWCGDFLNYKKNGENYWERVLLIPISSPDSKQISHYMSVKEDITQYKRRQLQTEARHKEIRQELSDANIVQKSFLPTDMEHHLFRLKTFFEPCSNLSGDFFDYIWLPKESKLIGYILDVMGHGIAAALQGASLRMLTRSILHSPLLPEKRMQLLNQHSFDSLADETFAGSILFELNFRTKKLTYVTAGINYFLANADKQTKIIKGPGMFLGLDSNAVYSKHTLPFRSGDSFCFMSDGLFDGLNHEMLKAPDLETSFEALTQAAKKARQKDDATGILIAIQ